MKFLIDCIVIIVCCSIAVFLYINYWDTFKETLFNIEPQYPIYIGSVAATVTVADDHDERMLGLSGTPSLRDLEGKLFIFDSDDKHGIWMKDMRIPLDIIWVDKDLNVVHIAENVDPSTYPEVFASPSDARFVIEMNAHFVSSLKIAVGDRLTLPSVLIPNDIKTNLQQ